MGELPRERLAWRGIWKRISSHVMIVAATGKKEAQRELFNWFREKGHDVSLGDIVICRPLNWTGGGGFKTCVLGLEADTPKLMEPTL